VTLGRFGRFGVPWTGLVHSVAGTSLAHFVGLIRSLSAVAA
jgi:hypothetical protein